MSVFREFRAALATGLHANLTQPRHALLIMAGFLIASFTLSALLTIPAGLRGLAGHTGLDDIAMVIPGSSLDESASTLAPEQAKLASTLPGVATSASGQPLVAPQFVVHAKLRRLDGTLATVLIRGVPPSFWDIIQPAAQITTGQRFAIGNNALVAGRGASRSFAALDTGAQLQLNRVPWHVSGEMRAHDSVWESELWADISALQATYNAPGQITSLWVKLDSPSAFVGYARALRSDPRLHGLQVVSQHDYYASQVSFLFFFIRGATLAIAMALALGAILAITNALGTALLARRREIAILRAIGYRDTSLFLALLGEVLIVGLLCAIAALLLSWLSLDGHGIDSSTATQAIYFRLRLTPAIAGWTVAYTLLLGLISAAWPVLRVIRSPLVRSLRSE